MHRYQRFSNTYARHYLLTFTTSNTQNALINRDNKNDKTTCATAKDPYWVKVKFNDSWWEWIALCIIIASECMYKAIQWMVVTMNTDEETCSACLWMSTGQFDSNLAEVKSKFNEILQNKVMPLLHKHEWWCNAVMKNSHASVSTRKGLNFDGVWFGLLLMKNKVSKSLWIIIGSWWMLLIKSLTGVATQHPQGRYSN